MLLEKYLEPVNFCAENLMNLLDANDPQMKKVVEKGLLLYRQSFVYQVKFSNELVTGMIQDVTPVRATLDLDYVQQSSCTCHAEGFCRHQLALFFYLLAQVGKVSTWLENWRKPIENAEMLKNLGIMRASDLLKEKKDKEPNYTDWIETLEKSFQSLMETNHNKPYLIAETYYIYIRKIKAATPLQTEWKLLYLVIAHVFTFKQLLIVSKKLDHNTQTINRYYRHLFHDLMNSIEDNLYKLSNFTFPFAFDDFLISLKDDIRAILTIQPILAFECIQLYRLMWTDLFATKKWRQDELTQLSANSDPSFSEKIAMIHLEILLQKDENALKIIQSLDTQVTSYMLYWIDYLSSRKAWKRMDLYIPAFIQELKNYICTDDDDDYCYEFTQMAIRAILPYCLAMNKEDLLEKAYIHTLPYSYRKYEDFLYEKKQFDKWMDLFTMMGYGLDHLHKEQIKTLQEYDQSLLLSLYHRSIQEHIEGKNREHYRIAVRQLKKLRTLYKKLKKQTEFEQFLLVILERTKRLRAFHEECRKGKLIHAEN
ncbi:SWIM zinc finger family protein [Niallia sp. FSL M8-0099]|uniref:SWIM zinc finger family protein n=1 Tax=Niallia sp. FSL M8-0099 TaxID=2954519 RepID=UPI0030F78662